MSRTIIFKCGTVLSDLPREPPPEIKLCILIPADAQVVPTIDDIRLDEAGWNTLRSYEASAIPLGIDSGLAFLARCRLRDYQQAGTRLATVRGAIPDQLTGLS